MYYNLSIGAFNTTSVRRAMKMTPPATINLEKYMYAKTAKTALAICLLGFSIQSMAECSIPIAGPGCNAMRGMSMQCLIGTVLYVDTSPGVCNSGTLSSDLNFIQFGQQILYYCSQNDTTRQYPAPAEIKGKWQKLDNKTVSFPPPKGYSQTNFVYWKCI